MSSRPEQTPSSDAVSLASTTNASSNPLGTTGRALRPNALFAIVVTGVIMASLDQSINATALPTIDHALHTRVSWAGWTLTAYQLGLVIAFPIAGRIGDQFGRRKIYFFCVSIFAVSSLMCGLSQNIFELISFRFLQAIGGGGLVPSAVGFLTQHYGKNRDRAVGMIGAMSPIGSMSGPVIGGLIIRYWSWRGIFLINLPVAVVLLVLSVRFIPHTEPKPGQHIDRVGISLLVGTLLPTMLAITELGNGVREWSPSFLVPAIVAIASGACFCHHAKVDSAPIIPLRFLSHGSFARLNFINFLFGGTSLGVATLLAYYAETRYGFEPFRAATVLTARSVGSFSTATAAALLIRRVGFRKPMILGFCLSLTGMIWLSHSPLGLSSYLWLAIGAGIMGTGGGIQAPATTNAMLHTATEDAGLISGVRGMLRQSGAICSISVTTAIIARSAHPGIALGHVYLVLGIIVIVLAVPLAMSIPDHRGSW